jgi:predicted helicase
LVKNPAKKVEKAIIHYQDIGDYLSKEEKLKILSDFKTFTNSKFELTSLQPNEHGDWISLRNDAFGAFISIDSEKKFDTKAQAFFVVNSRGLETGRDAWVYNSSKEKLSLNIKSSVDFYNSEIERYATAQKSGVDINVNGFINTDPTKISWTSSLIAKLEKGEKAIFEKHKIGIGVYRPYFKQHVYRGDKMNHRRGQFEEFFPTPNFKNLVICVSARYKDGTVLITNLIPDLHFNGDTQAFPLYYYEENNATQKGLFDEDIEQQYIRRDAISDFIFEKSKKRYGKNVTKEDIFYYVYGFLHSKEYRETFANDLEKMLPRLPLVDDVRDFWVFSKAGRQLAELHLNYETVLPYPDAKVTGDDFFTVEKMRFPKKGQKDIIIYNSHITVSNIPDRAYQYVVNGKSAIEWIMERYQVTTHKESGIINNPNDWATEIGNPRYILDVLLSIINVSVQTVAIVENLPKLQLGTSEEIKAADPSKVAKVISSEEILANNVVPLYNLRAAAGNFSVWSQVEVSKWITLPAHIKPSKDLFACEVVGESMNRVIPNRSICLFRKCESGSRNGKIVLVQYNNLPAEDLAQGYTVKEYRSTKRNEEEQWSHKSIILRPLSTDSSFQDIVLLEDQSIDLKVLAIFETVLSSND